jgi:hypothetical protein
MIDPIVEEVRHWRMEHTRKFCGDLNLIYEDVRRIQESSGCEVVRRPPKLLNAEERSERRSRAMESG